MKHQKLPKEVRKTYSHPLLDAVIVMEPKEVTKTIVEWKALPFEQEMWFNVLAFFRWANDTMHSEVQVRLYLDATGKIMAWAHPQKARTGMTTTELPDEQDAGTPPNAGREDVVYIGTIHSHCDMNAFQSSIDLANERDQDGIHITVGKVSHETAVDLHGRTYIKEQELTLDWELMWDVGAEVRRLIPGNMLGEVAKFQMTRPAPKDWEFPTVWKDNVIEVKVEPVKAVAGYTQHTHYGVSYFQSGPTSWQQSRDERLKEVINSLDDEDRDLLRSLATEENISLLAGIEAHHRFFSGDCMSDFFTMFNDTEELAKGGLVGYDEHGKPVYDEDESGVEYYNG